MGFWGQLRRNVLRVFATGDKGHDGNPSSETLTHSFDDPTGVRTILEMPGHWRSDPDPNAAITMRDSRDGALLQITPLPAQLTEGLRPKLRKIIRDRADNALKSSVEKSIEVLEFRSEDGAGYYYFAQDRKPRPGSWAFMTSGAIANEQRVIRFTILSHLAPPAGAKEAMKALVGMRTVAMPQRFLDNTPYQLMNLLRELEALLDRNDPEGVAKLCASILSTPLSETAADDILELILPFVLNLAWALAVSQKARLVISPDEAVGSIESAISYLRRRNEPERLASALNNLGSVHMACVKGDLKDHLKAAMAAYKGAAAIYAELGTEGAVQAGHVMLHASDVYRRRPIGDLSTNVEMALACVESALESFVRSGNEEAVARGLSYRGITHINRSVGLKERNWLRALEDHSAALAIWQRLGATDPSFDQSIIEESRHVGSARAEVGRVTNDVTLIESAVELLTSTYQRVQAAGYGIDLQTALEILIARGYLLSYRKDRPDIFDDTIALVNDLEVWVDTHPVISPEHRLYERSWVDMQHCQVLMNWAVLHNDADMLDRAATTLERATAEFKRLGIDHRTIGLRIELARAFHEIGRLDQAEALFRSAGSDARARTQTAVSLTSLATLSKSVYKACQQLAFLQGQRGALCDAINTLESALAITLQRGALLSSRRDACDASLDERFMSLKQEYLSLIAGLERRDPALTQDLEGSISRISELDAALKEMTGTSDPGAVAFDCAAIARAIPENGIVVVPLTSNLGSLWICIDRPEREKMRLTSMESPEFSAAVRGMVGKLPFWKSVIDALKDDSEAVAGKAASELASSIEWLGRTVGQPLSRHLTSLGIERGAQVVVVSHGLLTLVPFHAATWQDGPRPELLSSAYTLTVIPSLTWLIHMQRQQETEGCDADQVVVVADSVGDLEGSTVEGGWIAKNVQDYKSSLLVGPQATKAALLKALPLALHLHVAGHSDYNLEMPFLSWLKLADGCMTIADLVSQTARAPMTAVLSSCSSGMNAGLYETSESWGFPYALHAWGVKMVISTLWPTLDIAMLLFFSEYYREGDAIRRPLVAFRRAQTYLRHVSADAARIRLHDICRDNHKGLTKLEEDLDWAVQRYGTSAPFCHPVFWAAVFCSGVPELALQTSPG